jgi:ABC-type uncharacterized transport system auxiliary subunit
MTRIARSVACLAVVAALVTATPGCLARRTPPIHYYTLSVPPPAAPALAAQIQISTLTADAGYSGTRIASRPSPHRVDYAPFHRWVATPPAMLAGVLDEYLVRATTPGSTRRVFVTGNLRRLEAVTHDSAPTAVLALSLAAELDGRRLLERRYDEREPIDGSGPEAAAAALSRALARILEDFAAALAARLAAS